MPPIPISLRHYAGARLPKALPEQKPWVIRDACSPTIHWLGSARSCSGFFMLGVSTQFPNSFPKECQRTVPANSASLIVPP